MRRREWLSGARLAALCGAAYAGLVLAWVWTERPVWLATGGRLDGNQTTTTVSLADGRYAAYSVEQLADGRGPVVRSTEVRLADGRYVRYRGAASAVVWVLYVIGPVGVAVVLATPVLLWLTLRLLRAERRASPAGGALPELPPGALDRSPATNASPPSGIARPPRVAPAPEPVGRDRPAESCPSGGWAGRRAARTAGVGGGRGEALWVLGGALAGLLAPVVLLNVLGLLVFPRGWRGWKAREGLVLERLCLAPPGAVLGALLGVYLAHRTWQALRMLRYALAGLLAPVVLFNVLGLVLNELWPLLYPGSPQHREGRQAWVYASLCLAPPGAVVGALLGAYRAHRERRDPDGG